MKTVLVFLAFLAGCSSCAGSLSYRRQVDKQTYGASVRLEVECPQGEVGGSGVAISPSTVLTANHVVDCDGMSPLSVIAITRDGVRARMLVVQQNQETDGAMLGSEFPGVFETWAAPSERIPNLGETLCIIGGDLRGVHSMRKCGDVADADGESIIVSLHVVPGNSGGGVFDANGRVVGIVSRGRWVSSQEFALLAVPTSRLF